MIKNPMKLVLMLALPLIALFLSYFLSTSNIYNCPDDWPTLLPCHDAPVEVYRGNPSFAVNGSIIWPSFAFGYVVWLVPSTLVVYGIPLLIKRLKKA
jgi:hypothetical protein